VNRLAGLPDPRRAPPAARQASTRRSASSGPITFWAALDETARHDFLARADRQTFPAGAEIMQQGELADHVAVILAGRVRVYVRDNERERVLALRESGDLVGERAALRIGVRSATVLALEKVRALIMTTEDFVAFVSDHPAVLKIVESQIYERLNEVAADGEHSPARLLRGQNCTIVVTDVVGFSAHTRNDLDRLAIRQAIAVMTVTAVEPFWNVCSWADRGDGLLVVVPPEIPTTAVLERLLTVLPAELWQHNSAHPAAVRIQLRVAVNVGPVVEDTFGLSGGAIIHAARMLEARVFKKAVAEQGSALGIIASAFVYEMAIKHGGDPLDPSDYVQVQVRVKETRSPAWIQLVGQPAA
jgi:CRP-like cAMP-binding protein